MATSMWYASRTNVFFRSLDMEDSNSPAAGMLRDRVRAVPGDVQVVCGSKGQTHPPHHRRTI